MKIICLEGDYNSIHSNKEYILATKPDSAVIKNGIDMYLPEFSNLIFGELEFVVKIDKVGKHISEEFANNYYNEITLGIDFTAMDLLEKLKEKQLPWEIAKGFDFSTKIGTFSPKENFFESLSASFSINEKEQFASEFTSLKNNINKTIAYVSKYFMLKKGDCIFLGNLLLERFKANENDYLEAFMNSQLNLDLKIR
ncbi:MAG: fumarylacetoacetate hydrolase family protein [Flavobacteriales bacterium]|nr:fumarylacetoacetate hydrolase family protein [Flavobacteriales bacterium]